MNSTSKLVMIGIHLGSHSGHAIHSFHKIILLGYPIDPELSTSLDLKSFIVAYMASATLWK